MQQHIDTQATIQNGVRQFELIDQLIQYPLAAFGQFVSAARKDEGRYRQSADGLQRFPLLVGKFGQLGRLAKLFLLIAGMLVVMLVANWRATLAVLALAVPLVVVTIYFFRWMRGLYQRVRHLYARISGFVTEYVQGVPILQAFGYERLTAGQALA